MDFKDHFSGHADIYAKYRPVYPKHMYDEIYKYVKNFGHVWDCGCGNGQVAIELAKAFDQVDASDASKEQISHAIPNDKVDYHVWKAEKSQLADSSVDLVTVGQAIHWFNFDLFFEEVKRVCKPDGILAVWTYKYLYVNEQIDKVLDVFFEKIHNYWPPERDIVYNEYSTIPFPFEEIPIPKMTIDKMLDARGVLNYLSTWSSVKNFRQQENRDPIEEFAPMLFEHWPEGGKQELEIKHPLILKVFRVG